MQDKQLTASPTLTLLWMAFLMTQILFCLVPWVAAMNQQPVQTPPWAMVLPLIALMDLALGSVLSRVLLTRAGQALRTQSGTTRPSDTDVLRAGFTALLIRWALFEFVTLIGMFHALLAMQPLIVVPYAAAATLGILISVPRAASLRSAMGID